MKITFAQALPPSAYARAITSSAEIDAAANELAHIRENYQANGVAVAGARDRIIKSWERCRSMSLDPAAQQPTVQVDPSELRSANEQLLRAADPILKMLADAFAGTGYVVLLTDECGRLVNVAGYLRARLSCADHGIAPGADLSEKSMGTNAVGTVIADGRALQMLAGEHLCDLAQRLTCTGAPIFRAQGREVAGVLSLSGNYRLLRSELIDVVMQSALDVEDHLAGNV